MGDIHYEIEYLGKTFKRHVDQIKAFNQEGPFRTTKTMKDRGRSRYHEQQTEPPNTTEAQQLGSREQGGEPAAPEEPAIPPRTTRGVATQNGEAVPALRRSTRVRKQTESFTPLGAGRFA